MLVRRKRRPEEEEELLVPHGLIWQATEDPMSPQPETAKPAVQQEAPKTTAGSVPPTPARSGANPATPPKPKLGAISPPLPWPSPKIQEIARPGRPRSSAVSPEAIKSSSISAPLRSGDPEAARTAPVTTGESGFAHRFLLRLGSERARMAEVFERTREHASRALLRTKAAVGKLEARVENSYQLSKLRRQIRDVEKMAGQHADVPQADPEAAVRTEQLRAARERALSLFASIRGRTEHAWSYTRLACGRALVLTRDSLHKAEQAARAFRITIKFRRPQSTTAEIWLARARDVKLRVMRRDSRLWTSMAMAMLSAVLALLVVSGVRGYAPDASPATVSRSTSTTPVAQPPRVAVTKPAPAARSVISKPAPTIVKPAIVKSAIAKPASLSEPERKVAAPKATRKRVHPSEDDDYVAKDTYVYYGLNGKPRR